MSSVTVVMATYNGANHIDEQLGSLATQTILPAELIVSDDGSTDETVQAVEDFGATAPFPVRIRRNERRLGYGENFLRAAGASKGEFVAFCDQDDIWHPEKLAVSVEVLTATKAKLFVHAARLVDTNGAPIGRFSQGIRGGQICQPLQLGPWSVFYGCSMVFPRSLLDLVDPAFRGRHTFEHSGLLSHDLWIYFLANSLGQVALDARELIDYRQHEHNSTPPLLGGGLRAWTTSLGLAAHPNVPRADIAAERARIMDTISELPDEVSLHPAAAAAATYWRNISSFEAARLKLYVCGGVVRRVETLVGLLLMHAYRPCRRGGLGRRLLLKDLIAGVLRIRRGS